MVGPVTAGAELALERPLNVIAPGYMQLSGTSFAAPVVAGVAAQILARHPRFTPDQVKGALMVATRDVPKDTVYAAGVGEVNAAKAAGVWSPPNPNAGLDRFVSTNAVDGSKSFNAVSWQEAARSAVGWDDVAWQDVAWQ